MYAYVNKNGLCFQTGIHILGKSDLQRFICNAVERQLTEGTKFYINEFSSLCQAESWFLLRKATFRTFGNLPVL